MTGAKATSAGAVNFPCSSSRAARMPSRSATSADARAHGSHSRAIRRPARRLLEAGELDRLSITLCPELVGAGARLFGEGPAGSSWSLAEAAPTSSGALCLRYDLIRPAAGR